MTDKAGDTALHVLDFQVNMKTFFRHERSQAIRPFHDCYPVAMEILLESEVLYFLLTAEAVEIHMIERNPATIFMEKPETRAGDITPIRYPCPTTDGLGDGRLASTQISRQGDNVSRHGSGTDVHAKGAGLFQAVQEYLDWFLVH